MKAAIVQEVRGKWQLKGIPIPKPDPNQVLIKMHASGICYTDVHMTEGKLPARPVSYTHLTLPTNREV